MGFRVNGFHDQWVGRREKQILTTPDGSHVHKVESGAPIYKRARCHFRAKSELKVNLRIGHFGGHRQETAMHRVRHVEQENKPTPELRRGKGEPSRVTAHKGPEMQRRVKGAVTSVKHPNAWRFQTLRMIQDHTKGLKRNRNNTGDTNPLTNASTTR